MMHMPLAELSWGYPCATDHDIHEVDFLLRVSAGFLALQMVENLHLLRRHGTHDVLRSGRDFLAL